MESILYSSLPDHDWKLNYHKVRVPSGASMASDAFTTFVTDIDMDNGYLRENQDQYLIDLFKIGRDIDQSCFTREFIEDTIELGIIVSEDGASSSDYEDDLSAFFEKYGTHIVTNASYGGKLVYKIPFDNTILVDDCGLGTLSF
jgi:hypothetical protein